MEKKTLKYVNCLGSGLFRLKIWVQPGAKTDNLAGIYQDRLKIRISAPAVDNKANKAVIKFLAKTLNVKKNQLEIESGHTSRGKNIRVKSETELCWTKLAGKAG